MASAQSPWQAAEVLAFTQHDGPGRPPSGPSGRSVGALAGVLVVTLTGILATDSLCPEHRAWVQALGGFAIFASGAGLVALARGWAGAAHLTLAASLAGVAIGVVDAMHSPTRGWLTVAGFGAACALAAAMSRKSLRLAAWDSRLTASAEAKVDGSVRTIGTPADVPPSVPEDGPQASELHSLR